jgi:hypothetical protein
MMNNSNIRLANASPVITPRAQVAWAHKGGPAPFLPNGRTGASYDIVKRKVVIFS